MKVRLLIAAILATTAWAPQSVQIASAIYCYPGDPPAVYQACVNYNSGIGQQVNNQNQLNNIQSQINNTISQINAIDVMIASLRNQIAAEKALIAQTQAAIDELSRQIRFGEASLIRQKAHVSVREQLLNQRLRYVDSHGSLNYIQLVLTSNSINQLMNRMVGAQQVAASDRRLLVGMEEEHAQIAQANTDLDGQRGQVSALLKQQKEAEADLEKNLATEAAALAFEKQLAAQLADQYNKVQAERAAIDAQVAQLAQKYNAEAVRAGGGNGSTASHDLLLFGREPGQHGLRDRAQRRFALGRLGDPRLRLAGARRRLLELPLPVVELPAAPVQLREPFGDRLFALVDPRLAFGELARLGSTGLGELRQPVTVILQRGRHAREGAGADFLLPLLSRFHRSPAPRLADWSVARRHTNGRRSPTARSWSPGSARRTRSGR